MEKVILGTILKIQKGKKPVKLQSTREEDFLPYVDIKAFEKNIIDKYTSDKNCLSCDEGDLLIVCDGSRSGLTGKAIKGFVGSTLAKISADGVLTDYLHYFLQGRYQQLNTNKKGTGTPHLNPVLLKSFEIIVPEIAQQRRIVAKIEELFSELDKGVSELQKVKAQLKVYRQAVLKEAFENSKQAATLGQYLLRIQAGKSFRCVERPPLENEIGIVKVSAVTWGEYDENESKTCNSLTMLKEEHVINSGDFLFSRANTQQLVGACVIVRETHKKLMLSDKILRFSFSNDINPWYILHYLRSGYGRKQIEILSTGNQESMRNIGQKRIESIKFPLYAKEKQTEIVHQIECRLSVCNKIEQTVNESLKKAEHLRQSILKQAFEGKLV